MNNKKESVKVCMSLENWVCVLECSVFCFDYEFRLYLYFIYIVVVFGLDKLEELV